MRARCASAQSDASPPRRAAEAANSEGLFLLSGLLADEWINGDSFIARQEVDQRVITVGEHASSPTSIACSSARGSPAAQATQLLKQYIPNGPAADVAEMYFVEAYVENIMGEHYCNGLVFSDVVNGAEKYGSPITDAAAFTLALAHADSGLALITGTSAADVKIQNALSVIARPHPARTSIARPTRRRRWPACRRTSSTTTSTRRRRIDNAIWNYNNIARRYSVSNGEGTNGLNFATAARSAHQGLSGWRRGVRRGRRHAQDA